MTESHTETTVTAHPLQIRDFRLLWLGGTAISLGVQFYAVGLVWLVLYLTGNGIALGGLLTIAAVPRAISMLLSGAFIDRYPPRNILIFSSLFNGILMSIALFLLGAGWMSMGALFIIAPISGLMDATFYPTNAALVPRLVTPSQLAPANALIQTADTLANIFGPSVSGVLIGEIGRLAGEPVVGLVAGFTVNTLLFVVGFIIFLNLSRKTDTITVPSPTTTQESLGKAILSGIRYAFGQAAVRISLILIALLNFAAIGPIVVGGALLVERRFGGDASMYGIISGGFGIGMLIGGALVSWMGQLKQPGMALVYTAFALAFGLAVLGFSPTFEIAFISCVFIGVFAAFTNINSITWMQMKTIPSMQGRISSLLVFAAVALDPFSNALSGIIAEINVTVLFCSASLLVAIGGIFALTTPTLREETTPLSE